MHVKPIVFFITKFSSTVLTVFAPTQAHFISRLPDLFSLRSTLVYLNISFNNFSGVPPEVLLLENLQFLKLRNNPLTELPDNISKCVVLLVVGRPGIT